MINKTSKLINSLSNNSNFEDKNWKKKLDRDGYVVIKNSKYMKHNLMHLKKSSELLMHEGDKGGWEGKEQYFKEGKKFESGAQRLGGLIKKTNHF